MLEHVGSGFLPFALVCCIYLYFRFAYRVARRDGVNWFEMPLIMFLLGMMVFMRLRNFRSVLPFGAKLCEGIVNISCSNHYLD